MSDSRTAAELGATAAFSRLKIAARGGSRLERELADHVLRLNNRVDALGMDQSTMSPRALKTHHAALQADAAALEERFAREQMNREMARREAWLAEASKPQKPSILNRLTRGRMGDAGGRRVITQVPQPRSRSLLNLLTFGTAGRSAVPAAEPVPQAKAIEAALARARGVSPAAAAAAAEAPAAAKGLGTLGKVGLGAGAVLGGGYLLKKLMENSQESGAPQAPPLPPDAVYYG